MCPSLIFNECWARCYTIFIPSCDSFIITTIALRDKFNIVIPQINCCLPDHFSVTILPCEFFMGEFYHSCQPFDKEFRDRKPHPILHPLSRFCMRHKVTVDPVLVEVTVPFRPLAIWTLSSFASRRNHAVLAIIK